MQNNAIRSITLGTPDDTTQLALDITLYGHNEMSTKELMTQETDQRPGVDKSDCIPPTATSKFRLHRIIC